MFLSTTFRDYKIFFSSLLIFGWYLCVEYFIENFFYVITTENRELFLDVRKTAL